MTSRLPAICVLAAALLTGCSSAPPPAKPDRMASPPFDEAVSLQHKYSGGWWTIDPRLCQDATPPGSPDGKFLVGIDIFNFTDRPIPMTWVLTGVQGQIQVNDGDDKEPVGGTITLQPGKHILGLWVQTREIEQFNCHTLDSGPHPSIDLQLR